MYDNVSPRSLRLSIDRSIERAMSRASIVSRRSTRSRVSICVGESSAETFSRSMLRLCKPSANPLVVESFNIYANSLNPTTPRVGNDDSSPERTASIRRAVSSKSMDRSPSSKRVGYPDTGPAIWRGPVLDDYSVEDRPQTNNHATHPAEYPSNMATRAASQMSEASPRITSKDAGGIQSSMSILSIGQKSARSSRPRGPVLDNEAPWTLASAPIGEAALEAADFIDEPSLKDPAATVRKSDALLDRFLPPEPKHAKPPSAAPASMEAMVGDDPRSDSEYADSDHDSADPAPPTSRTQVDVGTDISRPTSRYGVHKVIPLSRLPVENALLRRSNAVFPASDLRNVISTARGRPYQGPAWSFDERDGFEGMLRIVEFNDLPERSVFHIFSYLTEEEKSVAAQVCKLWRAWCYHRKAGWHTLHITLGLHRTDSSHVFDTPSAVKLIQSRFVELHTLHLSLHHLAHIDAIRSALSAIVAAAPLIERLEVRTPRHVFEGELRMVVTALRRLTAVALDLAPSDHLRLLEFPCDKIVELDMGPNRTDFDMCKQFPALKHLHRAEMSDEGLLRSLVENKVIVKSLGVHNINPALATESIRGLCWAGLERLDLRSTTLPPSAFKQLVPHLSNIFELATNTDMEPATFAELATYCWQLRTLLLCGRHAGTFGITPEVILSTIERMVRLRNLSLQYFGAQHLDSTFLYGCRQRCAHITEVSVHVCPGVSEVARKRYAASTWDLWARFQLTWVTPPTRSQRGGW